MDNIILRTNATEVYTYLSIINSRLPKGESLQGKSILDCGCGGQLPPLSIFSKQGMECHGIDISEKSLSMAHLFCSKHNINLKLRQGDMRDLPYPDNSFDYVYEHFSMCHLSHQDTAKAISEIMRVIKPGGMAFFGVISRDTWPLSMFGEEVNPGEYGNPREDDHYHSIFSDEQFWQIVKQWNIHSIKKSISHFDSEQTEKNWAKLYMEAPQEYSMEIWMDQYKNRLWWNKYVHIYCYAIK